jgi:hypothetical protein
MSKSKKKGVCVLCGRRGELTRDHIPPKSIFPKDTPRITIFSCERCNQGSSKDDEFLRLLLTFPLGASDMPEVKPLIEPTLRSFGKQEAAKYASSILGSVRSIEVTTPGGLFVGRHPALPIRRDRLECILRKIVRGLFYHELGYALPCGYGVAVMPYHPMKTGLSMSQFAEVGKLVHSMLTSPVKTVGGKMFTYRFGVSPNAKYRSVWAMVIGRLLGVFAFTDNLGTKPFE